MTRIVFIIPCLNEASALPILFEQIRAYLPEAEINIFDNGSTDSTVDISVRNGAKVHIVVERGKGRVVSRMFSDVDADIYVMVDGDATYDLSQLKEHISILIDKRVDMLVGTRLGSYGSSDSRRGHRAGNKILTGLLNRLFESRFNDVLSGYRIMSRRFVKSAPVMVDGFEVEVMLTIHALEIRTM